MADVRTFVLTDVKDNSNKFWEVETNGSSMTFRWGRVGHTPQTMTSTHNQKDIDKKIREKLKKGYEEIIVIKGANAAKAAGSETVKQAAFAQLAGGNITLTNLIERLVAANRHELHQASGGKIDVNLSTGAVTTPLGAITKTSIDAARLILKNMSDLIDANKNFVDSDQFISQLQSYLKLVPQRVGHARGWHRYVISDAAAIVRQSALLDQLEASADLAAAVDTTDDGKIPDLIQTKITECVDPAAILLVETMFERTRNRMHTSNNLKVKKVYDVDHGPMRDAYAKRGANMDDKRILWHGTRTFNVLSILKGGLIIPKRTGTFQITGRMFGDGLYFSDQSTKSLNYAQGYWDGGSRDNTCFMFLAEVAMGKAYQGTSRQSRYPVDGYDSTDVRGGTNSVMNNEMIVYSTDQVNLKHLIEFEPR